MQKIINNQNNKRINKVQIKPKLKKPNINNKTLTANPAKINTGVASDKILS